jgi:hypothetical protein
MLVSLQSLSLHLSRVLHIVSIYVLGAAALAAVLLTFLAAIGVVPWFTLMLQFGTAFVPSAGIWVQSGVTVLLCLLFFFIPSNGRILALENSHRNFHVSMQDVARAYHVCHTADRAGVFTMSSEFDQVRERLAFLRDHPDLAQLESGVLTLAAQMSQQARHLAEVYSDEKVARAKDVLAQRQREAEEQKVRIVEALHICRQIKRWADQVEVEEAIVASQLRQLDEQLQAALPMLGYGFEGLEDDLPVLDNVVSLSAPKPSHKATYPAAE